jgi:hypothetical protein
MKRTPELDAIVEAANEAAGKYQTGFAHDGLDFAFAMREDTIVKSMSAREKAAFKKYVKEANVVDTYEPYAVDFRTIRMKTGDALVGR